MIFIICCVNKIFFHEFRGLIYLFEFIRWQPPWFIGNPWTLRALLALEVNGIWSDHKKQRWVFKISGENIEALMFTHFLKEELIGWWWRYLLTSFAGPCSFQIPQLGQILNCEMSSKNCIFMIWTEEKGWVKVLREK